MLRIIRININITKPGRILSHKSSLKYLIKSLVFKFVECRPSLNLTIVYPGRTIKIYFGFVLCSEECVRVEMAA